LYFKKAIKHFKLNKNDGKSTKKALINNIENGLFFNKKTDWLHFGFATIALGRENIGTIINAKTAVSFRGFDIGVYPINNPNCYDLLWKTVDKIHVISDDITNLVLKNGFNKPDKIIKITPAINTNFFQPSTNDRQRQTINFTTIARLHWKKGIEYTLQALAILKQKGISFHYTIIGNGNEMERLQFAAHQFELTDNITFAGKLNPDAVKNQLEKTYIYLQYSIQEGFCNAVLEAQAMGIICVVSDAEGLSENVIDYKTGFVIPKRNPVYLANKILEVINLDDNKKSEISKTAISRVRTEFTTVKQTEKFISFYRTNN
jgi:colanic acid/amylovoran biosynthesis glycosyltransferase